MTIDYFGKIVNILYKKNKNNYVQPKLIRAHEKVVRTKENLTCKSNLRGRNIGDLFWQSL